MNRPFSIALVGPDEKTFNESHVREDLIVFDASISQDEGDFAKLTIEVENPRVGLIAPGRPLWVWFARNPNFENDASESDGAVFEDMVPEFFGRIIGVPEDITESTCRISFLAKPSDFEAQKAALADSLRVAPYFDGVWFDPDTRFDPDNVLESRSALWHIDRVTHVVTISDITTGEDGTIEVDEGTALDGSVSVSYGDPPCRQVNVTASVAWDQKAQGSVNVIGGSFGGLLNLSTIDTFTGQGFVDNWPATGTTIGGGWTVGFSLCQRIDGNGPDAWTFTDKLNAFSDADKGVVVICPTGQDPWSFNGWSFGGRCMSIKRWTLNMQLTANYDVTRGRTETVGFALKSDTQSILTDSTDGETSELTFSSSEVSSVVGVSGDSEGTLDIPIGKPNARAYFSTTRGAQSLEYLIMVARAKLVASARCVDVALEIPWDFALSENISLRKSLVLTDGRMPGGIAGGKIKSYSLTANGDSGAFNCSVTIGCSIGRGGAITATNGTPTYVDEGYVTKPYQRYVGEFIMPVAGEVAYESILGAPCSDDGFDFDRLSGVISQKPIFENPANEQQGLIATAPEPSSVYERINLKPTKCFFALKPLNNGPFATTYFVNTTLLTIPKTIDLEAESSS